MMISGMMGDIERRFGFYHLVLHRVARNGHADGGFIYQRGIRMRQGDRHGFSRKARWECLLALDYHIGVSRLNIPELLQPSTHEAGGFLGRGNVGIEDYQALIKQLSHIITSYRDLLHYFV